MMTFMRIQPSLAVAVATDARLQIKREKQQQTAATAAAAGSRI